MSETIKIKNHKLRLYGKINKKAVMGWLQLAIIFFILAVISSILGFGIVSGVTYEIAKWFIIIFAVLFVVSVIAHTAKRA